MKRWTTTANACEAPMPATKMLHAHPEKDVRHLRPGWRISSPDTELIIGEYRLDPRREPLKPATAMPEGIQLMAPQLI